MLELLQPPVPQSEQLSSVEKNILSVRKRYQKLEPSSSRQRARDLAHRLGITEAQWVASQCGSMRSIPLAGSPQEIFNQLGRLGRVMALTRNTWCVHERYGTYLNVQVQEPVGLVLGPDIDLRMFFSTWTHVWAVEEFGRNSLQFFDQAGDAIHKIYCTEHTYAAEYVSIVGEYASKVPLWPEPLPHAEDIPGEDSCTNDHVASVSLDQASLERFRQAWLGMTDTHDFYPMLKAFNLTRLEALKAAGDALTTRIAPEMVEEMLDAVSRSGIPVMCFVGNRGMLQIHTGSLLNIRRTGPWLNVLDPDFNLHLDTTKIDSVWTVRKPTSDGWVSSMEVYADSGELIVQFYGARKMGVPERTEWRDLLTVLSLEPFAK